jgi:predicted nucleic acid-binding protein
MVTPDVSRLFVDTNILVFATDADSPWESAAATELEQWRKQGTELCISVQVLREYLAVTTRPAPGQIDPPKITRLFSQTWPPSGRVSGFGRHPVCFRKAR